VRKSIVKTLRTGRRRRRRRRRRRSGRRRSGRRRRRSRRRRKLISMSTMSLGRRKKMKQSLLWVVLWVERNSSVEESPNLRFVAKTESESLFYPVHF
jgi:hypothetical protein